jgi:large subunit ribosomal protein L17
MLRNMATGLFLTERETDEFDGNAPKVAGRIVTTLHKAKEVRSLVEKCITIARRSLPHQESALEFDTDAARNTEAWNEWRKSDRWQKWVECRGPVVNAKRRVFAMLRDKDAVNICFDVVAPRFADRPGGYTRVLHLATVRLGDAGKQAILEFVGKNDRRAAEPMRPEFTAPESDPVDEQPAVAEDSDVTDSDVTDSEVVAGDQEVAAEVTAEVAGDVSDEASSDESPEEEKSDGE